MFDFLTSILKKLVGICQFIKINLSKLRFPSTPIVVLLFSSTKHEMLYKEVERCLTIPMQSKQSPETAGLETEKKMDSTPWNVFSVFATCELACPVILFLFWHKLPMPAQFWPFDLHAWIILGASFTSIIIFYNKVIRTW